MPVVEHLPLRTLKLDLERLPWLADEASFPHAEVALNVHNDDRGWHVDVSGVPSSRPFETAARFFAWEPAPGSCRGSIRWHAIDSMLVYHTGGGVFRTGCKVVQVRTAEVAPVPLIGKLFLAFRRHCADCASPRLVLLGPGLLGVAGTMPIQSRPVSVVELPLEEATGASVHFQIASDDANEWGRQMEAPAWGKGRVIGVALEVAYPIAVARITVI